MRNCERTDEAILVWQFPVLNLLLTLSQLYWLLRKRHLEKWRLKLNLQEKEVTERSTIWQIMSNPERCPLGQGLCHLVSWRTQPRRLSLVMMRNRDFFFQLLRKLCSMQQVFLSLAMSVAPPQQVMCSLCFNIASTWCGRLQSGSRCLVFSKTR